MLQTHRHLVLHEPDDRPVPCVGHCVQDAAEHAAISGEGGEQTFQPEGGGQDEEDSHQVGGNGGNLGGGPETFVEMFIASSPASVPETSHQAYVRIAW